MGSGVMRSERLIPLTCCKHNMDTLISARRFLSPILKTPRLRTLARTLYRCLLRLRYGKTGLALCSRHGRSWRLLIEVALWDDLEPNTYAWLRRTGKPGDT